jgi:hypothetical protein
MYNFILFFTPNISNYEKHFDFYDAVCVCVCVFM